MQTRSQTKQQQIKAEQQQLQAKQQQIVNKYEEIFKKFETITSHLSIKKFDDKTYNLSLNFDYCFFKANILHLLKIVDCTVLISNKIRNCVHLFEFIDLNLLNYYNVFCDNYEKSKKNLIQVNSFIFVLFQKIVEVDINIKLKTFKNADANDLLHICQNFTRIRSHIINYILPDIEKKAFDDLI
jgi:hypothetical protein